MTNVLKIALASAAFAALTTAPMFASAEEAAAEAPAAVEAVLVELENGATVKVVGEDVFVVGEDGTETPAPDGEHVAKDGSKITTSGGKIVQ